MTLLRGGGNANLHLENYRAIRTRTVDLLGKTAQTLLLLSNRFKLFQRPNMHFFALGSFIN